MANATARVAKDTISWGDGRQFPKVAVKTITADTTFYTRAMVGRNVDGYHAKFDDTVEMVLAGLVRGREGNPVLAAATQGDAGHELDLECPPFFQVAISSVAITDIGKKVYATFDNAGTLTAASTTYGNFIGTVESLVYNSGLTAVSGVAWVRACYEGIHGHARYNTSRVCAATGSITITKLDLFKTFIVPSTGAYSIVLPAVALTQAGDWIKFVKTTSDAVILTLDGNLSETIDGATTYTAIDAQYDCAEIVSNGSAWTIRNRDIA